LLVKGAVEVADWVPELTELGWRFARRAWPGPVNLIFPNSGRRGLARRLPENVRGLIVPNGEIALRSPAHPFVRDVLRFLPVPLVLARAPATDPRGATSAGSIADAGDFSMIVDCGPTQFGGEATAVRIEGDRWTIVRQGVVDASTVKRMAGTILLFVCTGNTCRSPMAEALCKVLLARRLKSTVDRLEDLGYVVLSAGMATSNGMPAAAHAIDVVRGRGGSLQQHTSRQLTQDLLRAADHVIAMTNDHLEALLDQAPECAPRARLLHPSGEDVDDPVGEVGLTYV
jgi:protein-tyrosine phosphatase